MRIKRLEIMGFKSFPERALIHFPAGICAVVGPNGCGKSNIVDAIRWVMGEQSPRQLRGRQMDDVLFNGARNLQPAGLAEVSLTLCNDGEPYHGKSLGPSEISITRRLFRSGDSEYLINKIPCRLKDIIQFFMDTGMGTKAYAIIEQGRIGFLVDARPEERRALIDEAAGITRYKAQKKEAEKKIESAEQNMTHISALMAETKRQINSLTRAARKAAEYKELREELKNLDLGLTRREYAALERRFSELAGSKNELETSQEGLLIGLEKIEVDLETIRLDIVAEEREAEAKAEAHFGLKSEFDKLLQEDAFQKRRIEENGSRRQKLGEELARLAEQRERRSADLVRLRASVEDLAGEIEAKKARLAQVRGDSDELRGEHDEAVSNRDAARQELADARNKLARLEEAAAGHERMAESQAARREEIAGEIEESQAELAEVDRRISGLAGRRDDLAFNLEEARARAGDFRRRMALARSEVESLVARERKIDSELAGVGSRLATLKDLQANFGWYPEGVKAVMSSPELIETGIVGPVAERLDPPPGYEAAVEAALGERLNFILVRDRLAAAGALEFVRQKSLGRCGFLSLADLGPLGEQDLTRALLGDFSLCETLAEAADLGPGRVALTRDGEYFGPGGVVVGGKGRNKDRGLLARRRDIEDLEVKVAALEEEKNRLAASGLEAARTLEGLKAGLVEAEEAGRTANNALVDVEKSLHGFTGRRGDLQGRLSSLARTLEEQAARAERIEAEIESALEEKERLIEAEYELAGEFEQAAERVKTFAGRLEAVRRLEQAASLEAAAMRERLNTATKETAGTEEWLREIQKQTAGIKDELARAEEDLAAMTGRRAEIAARLEGFEAKLAAAESLVSEQRKKVDGLRADLNARETEARQARRRRSELDEAVRKLELDLQEIVFKKQALKERIENEYKVDLAEEPFVEDAAPADGDPGPALKRRSELRKAIEALGEVNLTAIGEHDALMERYGFYRDQVEDLTRSIENLRDSIAKINRTCKIRFNSTFKAVDEKLREIFPLLFEGGEAWLTLTDETDPLDSGVEIHVHPPGKKLTVMSLLSGGEKALVALALIFALYLIKPSPFCLLDETDAPLDEANIDRFNRLLTRLGQSSQIIMVTHNKRTMQISQTLYGVTMEQPGCSKMVSVNLSELEGLEQNAQMVKAG
ncbi:MAG: chromosome segregation protein SMC [Pseudomonadota bacterium]